MEKEARKRALEIILEELNKPEDYEEERDEPRETESEESDEMEEGPEIIKGNKEADRRLKMAFKANK